MNMTERSHPLASVLYYEYLVRTGTDALNSKFRSIPKSKGHVDLHDLTPHSFDSQKVESRLLDASY